MILRITHYPFKEGNCKGCHKETAGDEVEFVKPAEELCRTCHGGKGRETDRPVHHPPAEEGTCTACHASHASRQDHLIRLPDNRACFKCHEEIKQAVKGKVKHKPVSEGCQSCHGAHSAMVKPLLMVPAGELCLQCHAAAIREGAVVHGPYAQKECVKCHTPHGSDQKGLLREATNALCTGCHAPIKAKLEPGHTHGVLEAGTCLSCHQPHQSSFPHLLKAKSENLCFDCHQGKLFVGQRFPHYPVAEKKCLSCHDPHGSLQGKSLKGEPNRVCTSCHSDKHGDSFPHPVDAVVKDVEVLDLEDRAKLDAKGRITCLGCHAPHGGSRAFFLRDDMEKGELCRRCHKDK